MTDHTCTGACPKCIPELSPEYWRQRAHSAEELVEALEEHTRLLLVRLSELDKEVSRLSNELTRFWA
jgi:predicted RNase H-like nuclease (RuvC/YqgF family)